MDAASNNSVDDIRSIKEKINFLPTLAKYRVYIIDEVHMLSPGAFNALLKTLEEPPEHVKFILATTEPQKLLPTILSRCQRFDFKKISNADLIKRMKIICKESNLTVTEGALNLIANLSEGAARDALSILERCIQDGETSVDENKIKDLVGIPKFTYVHNIIKGIIDKDIESSLNAMNEVLDEGKDLGNFLWEMIKHTKDILMYKVSKKNDIYSEEEIKQIAETSEKTTKEELINIIYKLSELENKIKWSSQKTIIFETEIIKLCAKNDTLSLEERIAKIEKQISEGNIKINTNKQNNSSLYEKNNVDVKERVNVNSLEESNASAMEKPKYEAKMEGTSKEIKSETAQRKEAKTEKLTKLADGIQITNWQNVLDDLKRQGKVMLYANLINTDAVEVNDMTVEIRFNNGLNSFRKELLQKPENMSILTKEVSILCGKEMHIKLQDASNVARSNTTQANDKSPKVQIDEAPKKIEEISDLDSLDIPINFIEE